MGILKFAIIGAAVAYGINHITKKRADGTSILDDVLDQAPEWKEKAQQFATQAIDQVKDTAANKVPFKNYDQSL